jgi:hypothetical protein
MAEPLMAKVRVTAPELDRKITPELDPHSLGTKRQKTVLELTVPETGVKEIEEA